MKLLVVSSMFPPVRAGEAHHTLLLCRALAERGQDVHLLTGDLPGTPEDASFSVHKRMKGWSWSDLPEFKRSLSELQPEAVLLFYTGWAYDNHHPMVTFAPSIARQVLPGVAFATKFPGLSCSRWIRIKVRNGPRLAVRVHSQLAAPWFTRDVRITATDPGYGTILSESGRLLIMSRSHLDGLAALNPIVREKAILSPPPCLTTICADPNGDVRQRSRALAGVTREQFLFTYFGYVMHGKGLEVLLPALKKLRQQGRAVRLMMVGGVPKYAGGYERRIRNLVKLLELSDVVIITGAYPTDGDHGSRYLRAADAFVLPFEDGVETSRSSLATCAFHARPVITTTHGRHDEIFQHGQNVLLTPVGDVDALAEAMARVMDDRALGQRLARGAERMVREWFSWDGEVARTLQALGAGRSSSTIG